MKKIIFISCFIFINLLLLSACVETTIDDVKEAYKICDYLCHSDKNEFSTYTISSYSFNSYKEEIEGNVINNQKTETNIKYIYDKIGYFYKKYDYKNHENDNYMITEEWVYIKDTKVYYARSGESNSLKLSKTYKVIECYDTSTTFYNFMLMCREVINLVEIYDSELLGKHLNDNELSRITDVLRIIISENKDEEIVGIPDIKIKNKNSLKIYRTYKNEGIETSGIQKLNVKEKFNDKVDIENGFLKEAETYSYQLIKPIDTLTDSSTEIISINNISLKFLCKKNYPNLNDYELAK